MHRSEFVIDGVTVIFEKFSRPEFESYIVRYIMEDDCTALDLTGILIPCTVEEARYEMENAKWSYDIPRDFFLHWLPARWIG